MMQGIGHLKKNPHVKYSHLTLVKVFKYSAISWFRFLQVVFLVQSKEDSAYYGLKIGF